MTKLGIAQLRSSLIYVRYRELVSHMLVLEPFLQDHGLSVGRDYLFLLSSKQVEKDAIFK